jgi:competence protein ComEA
VERWLPGGTRGVEGVRALAGRHRFGAVVALLVVVLVAVVTATVLASRQPAVESAPVLPPAISAGPAVATASRPPTTLVVSVVGKVSRPGLVTLSTGARVADAIEAAGGLLPGTDDTALNLARRLSDGEQIYVGVPVPAGVAATDDPTAASDAAPVRSGKGNKKGGDPNVKVNLNTATADQLETLPGVGPTTATRILNWRSQHGHFDSINQLRDVGGIGEARYSKIENLVTT